MENEVYKPTGDNVTVGSGISQAKKFHEAVRLVEGRMQSAVNKATNVALSAHHKGLPSPVQGDDPEWAGENAVNDTLLQQAELVQEVLYSCVQIMNLYDDRKRKAQIADVVIDAITRQLNHWTEWDRPDTLLFSARLQEALKKK